MGSKLENKNIFFPVLLSRAFVELTRLDVQIEFKIHDAKNSNMYQIWSGLYGWFRKWNNLRDSRDLSMAYGTTNRQSKKKNTKQKNNPESYV